MKLKLGILTSFCSLCLLAGGVTFGVGSASAYSFPMWPGYTPNPNTGAGTQYEDNDLDYINDVDGNGQLSVGDILTSVLEFENAIHLNESGLGIETVAMDTANDALVALAQIEVKDVVNGTFLFGEVGSTPMIQVYSGGPTNLDVLTGDPTLPAAIAAITDGTHLWDFSITDDTDTFWTYIGGTDFGVVNAGGPSTVYGFVNFGLNQVWGNDIFASLYNPSFQGIGGDGLVDLLGSANILGGSGLTNAFARSDTDVLLNPVPEPATMTLFGLGLVGFGFIGHRRRNRN